MPLLGVVLVLACLIVNGLRLCGSTVHATYMDLLPAEIVTSVTNNYTLRLG